MWEKVANSSSLSDLQSGEQNHEQCARAVLLVHHALSVKGRECIVTPDISTCDDFIGAWPYQKLKIICLLQSLKIEMMFPSRVKTVFAYSFKKLTYCLPLQLKKVGKLCAQ